ncbi:MAG: PleD family two-component system response regulator [Syntrophobacterales bacterium]|nr:PleD family two-component system response regulator [Syntrophobacterales bacterium]
MVRSLMDAPKQKILIIDDTPSSLMILGEDLKSNYEVYVATSGEEALKKIRRNPPDLILLDIMMPKMDGYEICRKLKEDIITKNIPVIFITSKNSEEDETKGLEMGAVDYITKPFSLPVVRARIKTHLELKRKTDLLEDLSNKDGLTGLFNRRKFDDFIAYEWKRAIRNRNPLSIFLIDIDYFKLFNDHYGHLAGDECLKKIASALLSVFRRATDFVARYGGEEFAVVLPDTDIETALNLANKTRTYIENLRIEHLYSPIAPYVTVSIGVAAMVPLFGCDYHLLVDAADRALYEAKLTGRNRICYNKL